MFRSSSGTDCANTITALGVGHKQQRAFDHADPREAILAVIVAIVLCAEAKGIGKYETCTGERDAVLGVVRRSLGVVPFKIVVIHGCTV
jgi:hypothetical protein